MTFDNQPVLWALPVLLFFGIFLMHRRSIRLEQCKSLTSPEGYRQLQKLARNRAVLFILSFSSLIIALSGPRWGERLVSEYSSGLDVVLAFDVSRSMDVQDGGPGLSRLDLSRQLALSLVDSRPGLRYAVTLGKGKGVLAVPLTDDRDTVMNLILALSSNVVSASGTDLRDLLEVSIRAFPEESPGKKRIILFSDGEDTKGSLAGVEKVLQAKGIGVVAIGVGSIQGLPVPQADGTSFLRRANGSPVISQLRESSLRQLAEASLGSYWNASQETVLPQLLSYLDTLVSGRSTMEYRREVPARQEWFVLAALLLFVIAKGLEEGLWKKI